MCTNHITKCGECRFSIIRQRFNICGSNWSQCKIEDLIEYERGGQSAKKCQGCEYMTARRIGALVMARIAYSADLQLRKGEDIKAMFEERRHNITFLDVQRQKKKMEENIKDARIKRKRGEEELVVVVKEEEQEQPERKRQQRQPQQEEKGETPPLPVRQRQPKTKGKQQQK